MSWETRTRLFLVLIVFIVAIYDTIAVWFGGNKASISYNTYEVSQVNPIIPFAIGVILGHLFWKQ